jgi:crotonobetainyl-CoA:carnitine CoA-transferase CaiB-like acyl-CoA transferase
MSGVTSGLAVIELGDQISSSYCTKLLADYGSDVLKVELPEGGRLRGAGPFRKDEPSIEGGGLFTFLNTSKRSVTIDWRTADGRKLVGRLLEQSDIVVHPFAGETRAAFALGSEDYEQAGLVEVAVTPYGLDGPYAEFESEPITTAALSGWMFCMGDHDKPPLFPGGPYIEYISGISAAAGALIAIAARANTGAGQVVDVSEFEVGVEALPFDPVRFGYSGRYRPRTDERYGDSATAAIYPCADGFVQFHEEWRTMDLLRILGGEELADDERFETAEARLLNRDALQQVLIDLLSKRGRWELFEECGREHIIMASVPDMTDLLQLKPHELRNYFHHLTQGALDGTPLPGPPIRFGDGEWRCEPAPTLGSANSEVLAGRLGVPPKEVVDSERKDVSNG